MTDHYNRYEKGLHPYSWAQIHQGALTESPTTTSFPHIKHKQYSAEETKLIWALWSYVRIAEGKTSKPYIQLDKKGTPLTSQASLEKGTWPGTHLSHELIAKIVHRAVWGAHSDNSQPSLETWLNRMDKFESQQPVECKDVQQESSGLWVDEVRDAYAAWHESGGGIEYPRLSAKVEIRDAGGNPVKSCGYNHRRPADENSKVGRRTCEHGDN